VRCKRLPDNWSRSSAAVEAIEVNAARHAANVLPIIREIQRAGAKSLRAIAEALNARGIATARVAQKHSGPCSCGAIRQPYEVGSGNTEG
jgi:hypothetical protein